MDIELIMGLLSMAVVAGATLATVAVAMVFIRLVQMIIEIAW